MSLRSVRNGPGVVVASSRIFAVNLRPHIVNLGVPQMVALRSTPSSEKNATFFLYCLIVAILDETPHPVKF